MFLLFLDRCFLVYHSHFLEKSVLLVMSSSPIPSGSAKRFRSSAVIWLLPVILGRSCCLTFSRFFSISILLKASGVVLVKKINFFSHSFSVAGVRVLW